MSRSATILRGAGSELGPTPPAHPANVAGGALSAIGEQVGDRLRAIRRQKGLSLHEVEARSGQEFKASVLGAYERGERALSVSRLVRLAELYDVPPDQLLPRETEGEVDISDGALDFEDGFTIDLVALQGVRDPDVEALSRYAARIQVQRQDFNGRYLTIRRDDLRVLAAVFGHGSDEFGARLEALGLRARV